VRAAGCGLRVAGCGGSVRCHLILRLPPGLEKEREIEAPSLEKEREIEAPSLEKEREIEAPSLKSIDRSGFRVQGLNWLGASGLGFRV
jgi:hypothetical protein